MADEAEKPNGNGVGASAKDEQAGGAIQVLGQYIKDLSFESPGAPQSLQGQKTEPKLGLEVNVNAKKIGDDVFETAIVLNADAKSDEGPIYTLELEYGGAFRLAGIPEDQLQPILLVNCPALLFPFVRRLVADITREGGFPPLFLDPIDFAKLFLDNVKRSQQKADA